MTVSILMVTYNQLAMTKRAVASIRKHTPASAYELIVVDNASADGTVEWLRAQPDIILLGQQKNLGFPAACNIGALQAKGDKLLLLNNDTVVTPRWLEQLTLALDSDERVGAVGPLTNFAGYGQTVETSYRTMEEMQSFADAFNATAPERWEERAKLIGFCLLIKRAAWEAAGPLDEGYGVGNYEDDDWCMSARLAGYKLLLCRDTFIHHEGHASFKNAKDAYRKAMLQNEKRFIGKWGFHPHISVNARDDLLRPLHFIKPGMSVLEIGCGCGATLLELRNRCKDVRLFGYESGSSAARVAALVAEKVWSGGEEVAVPSGTTGFDVIVLNDILSNPAPISLLKKIHGWLRNGGIVATSAPNRHYVEYVKAYLKPINRVPQEALLSKQEILQRFRQAGFSDIEIERIPSDTVAKPELDALGMLAGEAGKEELAVIYYIVSAVKRKGGELPESLRSNASGGAQKHGQAKGNPPKPSSPSPSSSQAMAEQRMSSLPKAQEDVAFTGERLILNSAVSGSHPDVLAEHIYRYRLARLHCAGKDVLDAACGAGYGARMIKDAGAASVTGVDIEPETIRLADRDYGGEGVSFQVGDALKLAFAKESFDVVVSFETIEHVTSGSAWLNEAARVLRLGGRLIISTPNREVTNPDRQFDQPVRNPYHSFEYSLGEFIGELSVLYDIEAIYGQTFVGPRGIVAPDWTDIVEAVGNDTAMAGLHPETVRHCGPVSLSRVKSARPAYVIAICRKKGRTNADA